MDAAAAAASTDAAAVKPWRYEPGATPLPLPSWVYIACAAVAALTIWMMAYTMTSPTAADDVHNQRRARRQSLMAAGRLVSATSASRASNATGGSRSFIDSAHFTSGSEGSAGERAPRGGRARRALVKHKLRSESRKPMGPQVVGGVSHDGMRGRDGLTTNVRSLTAGGGAGSSIAVRPQGRNRMPLAQRVGRRRDAKPRAHMDSSSGPASTSSSSGWSTSSVSSSSRSSSSRSRRGYRWRSSGSSDSCSSSCSSDSTSSHGRPRAARRQQVRGRGMGSRFSGAPDSRRRRHSREAPPTLSTSQAAPTVEHSHLRPPKQLMLGAAQRIAAAAAASRMTPPTSRQVRRANKIYAQMVNESVASLVAGVRHIAQVEANGDRRAAKASTGAWRSDGEQRGVQRFTLAGGEPGDHGVASVGEFDIDGAQVAALVQSTQARKIWDVLLEEHTVVRSVDAQTEVVHSVYRGVLAHHGHDVVCVSHSRETDVDGKKAWVLAETSVDGDLEAVASAPGITRSQLRFGGVVVVDTSRRPSRPRCRVHYFSVLAVSEGTPTPNVTLTAAKKVMAVARLRAAVDRSRSEATSPRAASRDAARAADEGGKHTGAAARGPVTGDGDHAAGGGDVLDSVVGAADVRGSAEAKADCKHPLVRDAKVLVMAGVWDGLSATIAQRAGFTSLLVSSAGVATTLLGEPNVARLRHTDVLEVAQRVIRAVHLPVVVDGLAASCTADVVARFAIDLYAAGAHGILLADHTEAATDNAASAVRTALQSASEHAGKVRAAVEARGHSDDFLVMASTDAAANAKGIADVIRRGCKYKDAGADVVVVTSLATREDLHEFVRAVPGPVMVHDSSAPEATAHSIDDLHEVGVITAGFSAKALHASAQALQAVFANVVQYGSASAAASLDSRTAPVPSAADGSIGVAEHPSRRAGKK